MPHSLSIIYTCTLLHVIQYLEQYLIFLVCVKNILHQTVRIHGLISTAPGPGQALPDLQREQLGNNACMPPAVGGLAALTCAVLPDDLCFDTGKILVYLHVDCRIATSANDRMCAMEAL